MQKVTETHGLYARFFPAVCTSVPVFVLWFFLSKDIIIRELSDYLINLKFYGGVSLSAVSLYFYAQVIRATAKHYEKECFDNDRGFPTTYLLTYADDTFSARYKDTVRSLINKYFNLNLPDPLEEEQDLLDAQRRIAEAVRLVRVKVGDGQLVRKYNIWYGFFRNLTGGSLYGMGFCALNILLGFWFVKSAVLIIASSILLVLYSVLLSYRKSILLQNGEAYAKQLISEFVAEG